MAKKTDRITGQETGFLGERVKTDKMYGNLLQKVILQRISTYHFEQEAAMLESTSNFGFKMTPR
jgi:hypothetical protein